MCSASPRRFASLQNTTFVFAGVQLKSQGPEPHRERGLQPPGLFLGVAVDNNVIRVALERAARCCPPLSVQTTAPARVQMSGA